MLSHCHPHCCYGLCVCLAGADRKPIYIGFGSMTVDDGGEVVDAIRTAVAATRVRAVVGAGGWGCLAAAAGDGGMMMGPDVFVIEDVPHDWLFKR